MTKWLTTGQMIDRLKVGDIAETEARKSDAFISGEYVNYVTITDEGLISFCDETGNHRPFLLFSLSDENRKLMWRIIPKYVRFHEAMSAHEFGKTVTYHHDKELTYTFKKELETGQFDQLANDSICLHELIEGAWTIED
ncbi:hypothetical protein [uncultured Metabacillus sp.]|uniref:hypothetical protein n=1 Tax=uncultured Metabacillus sp. TaxID=2860135 RepID=UPI002605D6AA|nr:hypothetical protein [uncultured Metabacillus sp.]